MTGVQLSSQEKQGRRGSGPQVRLDADDRLDDENRSRRRTRFTDLSGEQVADSLEWRCLPDRATPAETVVDHIRRQLVRIGGENRCQFGFPAAQTAGKRNRHQFPASFPPISRNRHHFPISQPDDEDTWVRHANGRSVWLNSRDRFADPLTPRTSTVSRVRDGIHLYNAIVGSDRVS